MRGERATGRGSSGSSSPRVLGFLGVPRFPRVSSGFLGFLGFLGSSVPRVPRFLRSSGSSVPRGTTPAGVAASSLGSAAQRATPGSRHPGLRPRQGSRQSSLPPLPRRLPASICNCVPCPWGLRCASTPGYWPGRLPASGLVEIGERFTPRNPRNPEEPQEPRNPRNRGTQGTRDPRTQRNPTVTASDDRARWACSASSRYP
jgi:hypothetical protein